MNYYLRAENYKTTIIEKGNEVLGRLGLIGWVGFKGRITLPDTTYKIEHANFWGTRYKIEKDGKKIGEMRTNWKGAVLIKLTDSDHQPVQFKMKHRGFFNFRFEVWVNEKFHLLTLHPETNWFKTNYRVEVHDSNYSPFPITELMAIIAYGTKIFNQNNGQ